MRHVLRNPLLLSLCLLPTLASAVDIQSGLWEISYSSMQSHARWVAADCGSLQPQ